MRMYTLKEVKKKRIGILLPTEREYERFMYFIDSNGIQSCLFRENEWDESKEKTSVSYGGLGFVFNSKKQKKEFGIKKFIRLEQLIMKDTKEKQKEKLQEGFASIDEFIYYLISNNIVEKKNILGTPSTLEEKEFRFLVSEDSYCFFDDLMQNITRIGDYFVKDLLYQIPEIGDSLTKIGVRLENKSNYIEENDGLILEDVIGDLDSRNKQRIFCEKAFNIPRSEFIDLEDLNNYCSHNALEIDEYHLCPFNIQISILFDENKKKYFDGIKELQKIGEYTVVNLIVNRDCLMFLLEDTNKYKNSMKSMIQYEMKEIMIKQSENTNVSYLNLTNLFLERFNKFLDYINVIAIKHSVLLKGIPIRFHYNLVNFAIRNDRFFNLDELSRDCSDMGFPIITSSIKSGTNDYKIQISIKNDESFLNNNKQYKEKTKIKIFDIFTEIEEVATNYYSIAHFYKNNNLDIEIEYINGGSGTITYKTKRTRDSDYQKLLQVKNSDCVSLNNIWHP